MEFAKDSLIAQIYEHDAENFELTKRQLGAAVLLADDVLLLYKQLDTMVEPYLALPSSQMAGCLYTLCSKHLVLGALSLLRLHAAPACRETRSAVECAGIAYVIQKDPTKYRIFVNDTGENEKARKIARNTFKPKVIFPESEPRIRRLEQFYDDASMLSHTNKTTFIQHLTNMKPGGTKVTFNYQDITPEAVATLLPAMLLFVCKAHLGILLAANLVFEGIPQDEVDCFNAKHKMVSDRAGRFAQAFGLE
jgi:hypothetical protein